MKKEIVINEILHCLWILNECEAQMKKNKNTKQPPSSQLVVYLINSAQFVIDVYSDFKAQWKKEKNVAWVRRDLAFDILFGDE
jgi:hypothetical protein